MVTGTDLRQQLLNLISEIGVPREERANSVRETQNIIQKLVETMKDVSPLFEEIYKEITYTGSSYENLKIYSADEFDLNLKFQLPFNDRQFQVQHRHFPPSFAKYKLSQTLDILTMYDQELQKELEELFNEKYLSRIKVNRWMQSLVDAALARNNSNQIKVNRHGAPASTILITLSNGQEISVDLVPVFQLQHIPRSIRQQRLDKINRRIEITQHYNQSYLIPKPPPREKDVDDIFKISLPEIEKTISTYPGLFKPLIRVFKEIRSRNGWEYNFPSYFVKTAFMNQLLLRKSDFWEERNLVRTFNAMLKVFINIFKKKELPNFFIPRFDLLEKFDNTDVLNQMERKFQLILTTQQIQ